MYRKKVVFRLVLTLIITLTIGCRSDKSDLKEEVAIAMN